MASGYRDYWLNAINEKTIQGVYQTDWGRSVLESINGESSETILEYTVPVGYVLYVSQAVISSEMPGINLLQLINFTSSVFYTYFDTVLPLTFTANNVFPVPAGTKIGVRITNNDSEAAGFGATLTGYLVDITS